MADYNADDLYGGYEYDGNQAVTFSSLHAIIANLKVGAAQIEKASINDAHIQHLSGKVIEINADTTFADGYDPTKIEVGGRNLVPNSKIGETSSAYGFGTRRLTIDLIAGETYTITVNGRVDQQALNDGRWLEVFLYDPTWSYAVNFSVKSTTDTTVSAQWVAPWTGRYDITSYLYPSGGSRLGKATVNWIKVEKGNKTTDWTPAPEDQVQLNQLYNGVKIDSVSGFTATRSDGLARSIMNATEGIRLQKWSGGAWADSLYADTDGNLIFRGFLKIEESQYTSRVYIERGYMRVDNGTGGGRVATVQEGKFTAYDDGNFQAITIDGNHIGFLDRHPETLRGEVANISFDRDWNIYLNGTVRTSTVYANGWFRAQGQSGFYFQDYGGGWYMIDSSWIRSYNNKHLFLGAGIGAQFDYWIGASNTNILRLGEWGTGIIDLQGGAARWQVDPYNYFHIQPGSARVYVGGVVKASWASLPKVTVEPSGDGIMDGNEFGVNNSGSMQPSLEDFIITELDGTHEISLDEKYIKFVEGFFVQVFEGNARVVSKTSSSFKVEGQGPVAFLVKGIQKGKSDLAGYGFKRVDVDGDGNYETDFLPVYRNPTFNQCLVPASY